MSWSFYDANGKLLQGVLAGSVDTTELVDDAVTAAKLASDAVVNLSVASGAAIAYAKLAALADGNILVGNGSNVAVSVSPSGDIDVSNAGVLSLNSTAISGFSAKTSIADADTILLGDSAASGALKKMTKVNFVAGLGGAALTGSTNNTIVTVTGADAIQGEAALTYYNGTLQIDYSGVASFNLDGTGQSTIRLKNNGTTKWEIGMDTDGSTGMKSHVDDYTFYSGGTYGVVISGNGSNKFGIGTEAGIATDGAEIPDSGITIGLGNTTSGSDTAQRTTLYGNISCLAYGNAHQSMAHASVVTISMENNVWDSDNMDDSGTGITIRKAGVYLIKGAIHYAGNSSGARYLSIYTNGSAHDVTQDELPPHGSNYTAMVMGIQELAVDDVVYLKCRQTSGGALNSLQQGRNFPHLTVVRLC